MNSAERAVPTVFISHSGHDFSFAQKLVRDLARYGIRSHLDKTELRVGDRFVKWMSDAARTCDYMVALLTPDSSGYWFEVEWTAALAREKYLKRVFLIPALLFGTKEEDIPPLLASKIYIDFRKDYSAGLRDLVQRIKPSWENYSDWLLDLGGYTVAFIPLLNRCGHKVRTLSMQEIEVVKDSNEYNLPEEFANTNLPYEFRNDPDRSECCRLSSYEVLDNGHLKVNFALTKYEDYLKSGEHLDDPLPYDQKKSFRDAFGRLLRQYQGVGDLVPFELTNICGIGVFIITEDGWIVAARQSDHAKVYPGRWTFSASGTLLWGAYPHPFIRAAQKCYDEIRHQINMDNLEAITFGADARKLYFEFSLIERTEASYREIERRCGGRMQLDKIRFSLERVLTCLMERCWEPAAEATLLTLCAKEYTWDSVVQKLEDRRVEWSRRLMRDEWDYRADRSGDLAVMSVRYPASERAKQSAAFVTKVVEFLGDEIAGKKVFEIGCGTGRITERLVERAQKLICVDLCHKMIQRNKERLGANAERVEYIPAFMQELDSVPQHDVAISCLVLIHNVVDSDFSLLVSKLGQHTRTVFVIEDVSQDRVTSPYTHLRSEDTLIAEFAGHGYQVERFERYQMFEDEIAFIKFARRSLAS